MKNLTSLSLYVHLPWCVKKCPYCDFNSHAKDLFFDEKNYLKALLKELRQHHKHLGQRKLGSIFFGGGTPSLFSVDAIAQIIGTAKQLFDVDKVEITLEANPGTIDQEKFHGYYQNGVNRLSIGVQSFNNQHLQALGRIHDSQKALDAVKLAKSAGFNNINIDLMFGLPQQNLAQAMQDVKTACSLDVGHISHYQLTIEENTFFHKHPPKLPQSDELWEIQTQCQSYLAQAGYQQYEVSAYTKNNQMCQHNLNYWHFGDYIGIGAGAHSKLSQYKNKQLVVKRFYNYRQPQQYIQKMKHTNATAGSQTLATDELTFEFLLNTLRLKSDTDIALYTQQTGLPVTHLQQAIKQIEPNLLLIKNNKLITTKKAYDFLNTILEKLL